jgi:predicted MFS family arabinose efflux permease
VSGDPAADRRGILLAQGVRAAAYGLGAVLLGAGTAARGWSPRTVGVLLAAVVAGTALASIGVGAFAERLGRRRCYALLYGTLAVTGLVFGLTDRLWPLVAVALLGVLSTEVVESGPFTSLEQAMLAQTIPPQRSSRTFARYNAVATVAGSLGALAAGSPAAVHLHLGHAAATDRRLFWLLVPVGLAGMLLAGRLSARVEAPPPHRGGQRPLQRSRRTVRSLAGLFAADALGGGLVVQSFLAYWFQRRFGLSLQALGLLFFTVGLLQTASFLAAGRLAERFGLLNTMVFTHLPSNLLLVAIVFAPNRAVAVGLLLARFALSQMDVPTRQAYVMALVDPGERAAAAAWTNTARYLVRPAGTAVAGTAAQAALGAPFLLAGSIKAAYDLVLWSWFRNVPLPQATVPAPPTAAAVPNRHGNKEQP